MGRTELLPRDDVLEDERKVDVGEGLVELEGVLRVVDAVDDEAVPGALTRLVVVRLAGVVADEDVRGRRAVEVFVFVIAEEAMDARLAEREGPGVEEGLPLCGEDDDVGTASELEATRRVALEMAGRVELEREGVDGDLRTVEGAGGARVLAAAALEAAVVVDVEEEGVRVEEVAEVAVEAVALLKVVGIAGRGLTGVLVVDDVVAAVVVVGLTLEDDPVAAAVVAVVAFNKPAVNGFLADV